MIKTIYLGHSRWTVVDDEDYARLEEENLIWSWCAHVSTNTVYAVRGIQIGDRKHRKQKLVFLHRQILDAPDDMEVDHIDKDGLNNRRSNLRLATRSQNLANRTVLNTSSGYRGVQRNRNGWQAVIWVTRKRFLLGTYHSREEAALAYNKAALEAYGEFATLNVVPLQ